jgi:hypothetical protein
MLRENLTPQAAALRFGVCLGTVRLVAVSEELLPHSRCEGCGGLVVKPCRKCFCDTIRRERLAAAKQTQAEPVSC